MADLYQGDVADLFEDSYGTSLTVPNKKTFTGDVADLFKDDYDDSENQIFDSKLSGKKLKIENFYERENLNIIREYMYRNKGEDYRTMEDDNKLVNDFVDHMRWFNANTLSTAGEVQFVRKGSDADKAAAGDAYRLYDSLGNLFTRGETIGGQIDGIKDYIFAAAVDPSNYLGLLTGGVGRAATLGVTTEAKRRIKNAGLIAYKEAIKKGANSEAVKKAVKSAQDDLIGKIGKDAATSKAGKLALNQAAINTRREAYRKLGYTSLKDFEKSRQLKGRAAELGGTFVADATVAAFQDLAIQDLYLDVNVDDSVNSINKKQLMLNTILGGAVAPAFSLAGSSAAALSRSVGKKTSLADATREMSKRKFATKGTVDADIGFEATKVIRQGYKSWADKVKAGDDIRGARDMPEGLLGEILLGADGEAGLVGMLKQRGITVNKDTFISDFLTDVIRVMPDEDFIALSKDFERGSGISLGEVATAKVKLSDVIASYASGLGRELSVLAQAKSKLNAGVVMGNDLINEALDRKEIRDSLEDGLTGFLTKSGTFKTGAKISLKSNKAKRGSILEMKDGKALVVFDGTKKTAKPREYEIEKLNLVADKEKQPKSLMWFQNVWRRTLVSSVPTTAANIFGWSQYYLGQSVADTLNGGMFYAYGMLRGNTDAGREARRVGKVYAQIQGDKFRNLLDPFTTHDSYMKFLEENKNVRDLLHETVGGTGVEISSAKFDMNPDGKIYKNVEAFVNAATKLTGVRAQDTFTKSQMFMTELDKHLRIKTKNSTSLAEVMRTNNINAIDEDVIGLALDSTMKSVFSKDYTTVDQMPAIRNAAKFVESISNIPVLGSVLPFGRFFNNTIATVYQVGPLGLVSPTAAIMRGKADIQTAEAFSRAAVGTTGLIIAARMAQENEDSGNTATMLNVGGGTTIDTRNAFPMSEFLAMGKLLNQLASQGNLGPLGNVFGGETEPTIERRGNIPYYDTSTQEAIKESLVQIGVGQFAQDIEFGNDMYRILNMMFDETNGEAGAAELQRRAGSFAAGFTRPFQTIDRAVGFIRDTDINKDKRQKAIINDKGEVELVKRSGGEVFSLEATRYLDNILDIFRDTNAENDFSQLRVATREGDLYDPNPLASIFGVRVVPGKTASEKVYTMAGLKGFKANKRSQVAMYDRLFNETMSPLLERKARKLLADKKFINGTNTYRRQEVSKILKQTRSAINEAMPLLSENHRINKQRYDTINYSGGSEQYKNAKKAFHKIRLEKLRDEGATADELKALEIKDPLTMNESELTQFKAILSLYKETAKGE